MPDDNTAASGTTPAPPAPPAAPPAAKPPADDGATIPYSRFQKVVAERNALQQSLEASGAEKAAMAQQLEAAKAAAAKAEQWQSKFEAETHARQQDRAMFAENEQLADLGFTGQLRDAVRWQHSQLGEDAGNIVDVAKQWREDPTQAPMLLQPHLTAGNSPQQSRQRRAPAQPNAGTDSGRPPAGQPAPTDPTARQKWYREQRAAGRSAAEIARAQSYNQ